MKIFVTGHKGDLGKVVCNKLAEEFEIVGYDIAANPEDNLLDFERLKSAMEGCEMVVHLAGLPTPRRGKVEDYFNINVVGSWNTLRAARDNKVKRFIYTSSTAYYGCDIDGKLEPLYFPIDENHPVASQGIGKGKLEPYNQSKVIVEQLCAWFGTNEIFETICLRFAPANTNNDQYPQGFSWQDCNTYQRGAFWANCPPSLVAEAILLALKSPKKFTYEAYNVANKNTDKKVNVKEFLEREYPETSVKIPLDDNPCLIDTSKIRKELGLK
jgi:nucleoside-diphosphate-sugar epimerase